MAAAKQFGRYRIIKHLATGGMAEVLLASATGIEGFTRYVVIKQIDQQSSQSPTFVKMFLDEARLAASLHHHNIVQVHDIGREGGTYFFAMEYLHGEDLRKLLQEVVARKSVMPLEHVLTIVSAAASALHYAHEHCGPDRKPLNLVHRDVSPSNILVGFDGNVKIVDFGIAKTAIATTETRFGDIKGKFSYMSPEQCLGKVVDRRSDVFALGIVLHELVTARKLFRGASDFDKMKEVIEGTIAPPSLYRPDISPELDSIILKALEKDPADRYRTADELRVALEQFAIGNRIRTSTSGLADYMKQLFGERPAPWLSDDYEPDVTIDDVEAAPSNAVPSEVPAAPSRSVVTPNVLIRAKAPTMYPVGFIENATPEAYTASTRRIPTFPVGSTTTTSETAADGEADSKTPMAWESEPQPSDAPPTTTTRRKWRLPAFAAAVMVPVLAVGFTMTRSSSGAQPDAAMRASAAPMAAPVAAPHVAPPVDTPVKARAVAPRVTAPAVAAPAVDTPAVARDVAPSVATPPAPSTPAPEPRPVPPAPAAAAREEKSPAPPPAKRTEKKHRARSAEPSAAKKPAWDPDALTPE